MINHMNKHEIVSIEPLIAFFLRFNLDAFLCFLAFLFVSLKKALAHRCLLQLSSSSHSPEESVAHITVNAQLRCCVLFLRSPLLFWRLWELWFYSPLDSVGYILLQKIPLFQILHILPDLLFAMKNEGQCGMVLRDWPLARALIIVWPMCFRDKLALIPLYDIGNQLGSRYFIITRSSYTVNYASKSWGGVLLSLNLKSENSFLKRGGY